MEKTIALLIFAGGSFIVALFQGWAALGNAAGVDEPVKALNRMLRALGFAVLCGIFLGPLIFD